MAIKFKNQTSLLAFPLLLLAFINPVIAAEPTANTELTDEEAQIIFDLAIEQRDSGKIFDAIENFEYILGRRPSLNRARLELAVSYHRANQYENALRSFQTVLDDPGTPEKVRLAILAYLGQLTSDEMKPKTENSFSYYTKVGLLYNTNINFAPLRGSIDYQIADGRDTESPGLDTFLSASHRYIDNRPFNIDGAATHFEWQSQISWTGNNYTRESDFNLNTFSASTGPAFISTGRWRAAVNLQIDQIFFGTSTLGTFVSLNPLITFDLGNYRGITLEGAYSANNYVRAEDLGRDGDSVMAGAAYTTLLGGIDNGLETGFRLTQMHTDDAQYSYDSGEIYFGGFIAHQANSNFYLNLNFKNFNFDAADTTTGTVRDEIESNYTLGYNMDLTEGALQGWTLNSYISFTKNNSNIDAFSYERTLFAINLARYFI